MKKMSLILPVTLVMALAGYAMASPERDAILKGYADQAKAADANFSAFSADKGKELFLSQHQGDNPDVTSCSSCHTKDPTKAGQTRAGKAIDPMAVSVTPARFTDPAKVEKWFGRNCKSVLGRECTPVEKGDFITYMSGL